MNAYTFRFPGAKHGMGGVAVVVAEDETEARCCLGVVASADLTRGEPELVDCRHGHAGVVYFWDGDY